MNKCLSVHISYCKFAVNVFSVLPYHETEENIFFNIKIALY